VVNRWPPTELAKPENAKLVRIAYGDDLKSFQETPGLPGSYPDLTVIVSPTTGGIAAASRYVSSSNFDQFDF
jgi:rhamnose transport system substrate-binding protein